MKKDVQNLKKTLRHISKFFVAVKCKLLFSLKRLPNSLSLINWARQSSETGIYLSLSYTFISLTASALNLSTAPPSTLPGRSTVIIPFLPKYTSAAGLLHSAALWGERLTALVLLWRSKWSRKVQSPVMNIYKQLWSGDYCICVIKLIIIIIIINHN